MTRHSPVRSLRGLWLFFAVALLARAASAQDAGISSFENLSVGPAERTETSRLTDAGVLNIGDAGGMVVTLAGELRGRAERNGSIGVLLLPELPFFNYAYRNRKVMMSVADAEATINAGESSYFLSKSKHVEAGFTQYHLFLFNTTGATAMVNVYVHPTRS
ncbi:MAG TPA: hypothetical protein VJA66_03845 [Thermoanaerobaculia bacterium]